jgi:hypothetical protein
LVVWLEDQKIRFYPVDQRSKLRQNSNNWHNDYNKYLKDLGCPQELFEGSDNANSQSICWLLGYALKLDNQNQGNDDQSPVVKSSESLQSIDGNFPLFSLFLSQTPDDAVFQSKVKNSRMELQHCLNCSRFHLIQITLFNLMLVVNFSKPESTKTRPKVLLLLLGTLFNFQ